MVSPIVLLNIILSLIIWLWSIWSSFYWLGSQWFSHIIKTISVVSHQELYMLYTTTKY